MNTLPVETRVSIHSPDEDWPSKRHSLSFDYVCDEGNLDCNYDVESDSFCIDDLYVQSHARNKGIGKQLLRSAKFSAEQIGSHDVYAYIFSKECLNAMLQVFGSGNIRILKDGDYAPHGLDRHPTKRTHAVLHYDASKKK
ncbi:MAG: N-acetyltransferase [Chloroflexi bacterium]|nr:MAG: N-acetyltransferase [Chloroflexota bacterium]